ncbi:MAG: hypothetical protein V4498_05990 [candidate division FCPU426 bacterium]
MKTIIALALWLAVLGLAACASAKKDTKIPSEMQPHKGMSESRAKGLGEGAIFSK